MKNKIRLLVVGLLILFLLSSVSSVLPSPEFTVNYTKPFLVVNYSEYVNIAEFSLIKNNSQVPLNLVNRTENVFYYEPGYTLPNGIYTFSIKAEDSVGNTQSLPFNKDFTVNAPKTELTLLSPRFGVSNTSSFSIVFETTRESQCRYSLNVNTSYDNSITILSNQQKLLHTIYDYLPINPSGEVLYVRCREENNNNVSGVFVFRVDTSIPVITLTADPSLVTQILTNRLLPFTTIKVSSGEDVICRYSKLSNVSYPQMTLFSLNNPSDMNTFKKSNAQNVDFENGLRHSETFFVQCEDLAGSLSEKKSLAVEVNLDAPMTITIYSPLSSTSKTQELLNFSTNKQAVCSYVKKSTNQTGYTSSYSSGGMTYSRIHTAQLVGLTLGQNEYTITCRPEDSINQVTKDFFVVLDTSKPQGSVKVENYTCLNHFGYSSLKATFSGADNESSITGYNYTLLDKSGYSVVNWTETYSSTVTEGPIQFNPQKQYYFKVIVKNSADILSDTVTSSPINILSNTSLECRESIPPTIKVEQKNTAKGLNVTLVCSDSSGCDPSKTKYGTSLSNKDNCVPSRLYTAPVELTESSYFCWEVFDNVGNKAKNITYINVTASMSCEDGIKNRGETDIDCGGFDCEACDSGKTCIDDSDCGSNNCIKSKCVSVESCTDRIKNQNETDVDCGGGNCDKCSIGKQCKLDSDCKQNSYCDRTCKSEDERDTDSDGMPDSWEDDNKLDKNDPSDADKDPDGDGFNNLIEYNAGTDPNDKDSHPDDETPGGFGLINWLLLILGIICIIFGVSYIVQKKTKKTVKNLPQGQKTQSAQVIRLSPEQERAKEKQRMEFMRSRVNQIKAKREEARKKLFSAFSTQKSAPKVESIKVLDKKIEEVAKEKSQKELSLMTQEELNEKIHSLIKPEVNDSIKKLQSKISEEKREDVFKRLSKVVKSTPKQEAKKNIFNELSSITKQPIEAQIVKSRELDPFQALTKLAKIKDPEFINLGKMNSVSKKDIIDVIKKVSKREKVPVEILEVVISYLASMGKITKKDIKEILLKLRNDDVFLAQDYNSALKYFELK